MPGYAHAFVRVKLASGSKEALFIETKGCIDKGQVYTLDNLADLRYINGAYTIYFNKKYQRSGHLLQGRHKAIVVDKDEYAPGLSRHIHLNPVRAGIVNDPGRYRWSSYKYYTEKGKSLNGSLRISSLVILEKTFIMHKKAIVSLSMNVSVVNMKIL